MYVARYCTYCMSLSSLVAIALYSPKCQWCIAAQTGAKSIGRLVALNSKLTTIKVVAK